MGERIKPSGSDRLFDIVNVLVLSLVLLAVTYPLLFVISSSLSNPMLVLQGEVWLWPKGFNLDAYLRVLQNNDIAIGYKNTIFYTLTGTAINLVMTIAAAYPLSRRDFYGRNVIMAFVTFTMVFSGGLIPSYLVIKSLGLIGSTWAVILPGAVSVWNLIIMRTFFQTTIPVEMREAACLDGCSNIRFLARIVLPLSKPIIAVMILYYAVGHWNSFFNALMYLTDRKDYPLQLVLREVLIQSDLQDMVSSDSESIAKQQMLAEGLKYAVIIVSSLPVLILYPFLQKYFVKGMMIGALKG